MREILATEMLEALGVDTSKTFSLIETGEALMRGDEPSPTRSSVLVRLSHSHIRIGTFQRLAFLDDNAGDRTAARLRRSTTISPNSPTAPAERRAGAFLEAVIARVATARRRAVWRRASSTACSIPTISTSPARASTTARGASRPIYDPGFTAAYFDESGLYAFGRQPGALAWNLTRLAECLLPLIGLEAAEKVLDAFPDAKAAFRAALLARLGLLSAGDERDARWPRPSSISR